VFLAVAESACRYRYPARFDDEVIVKTWVEAAHSRMVTFAYSMRLAEGGRETGGRPHQPHLRGQPNGAHAPAREILQPVRDRAAEGGLRGWGRPFGLPPAFEPAFFPRSRNAGAKARRSEDRRQAKRPAPLGYFRYRSKNSSMVASRWRAAAPLTPCDFCG